MYAKVTLRYKAQSFIFEIKIHQSDKIEDQQIEPGFYEQWTSKKAPHEGVHYEMEVVSPELKDHLYVSKIHIHPSVKNGKKFICWTGNIKDKVEVVELISMWCHGTVYTMVTGEDFAHLYQKHSIKSDDFKGMIALLKNEYQISLSEQKFDFIN